MNTRQFKRINELQRQVNSAAKNLDDLRLDMRSVIRTVKAVAEQVEIIGSVVEHALESAQLTLPKEPGEDPTDSVAAEDPSGGVPPDVVNTPTSENSGSAATAEVAVENP